MNRAYSTLEIKSVDDELRQIEGVASTPSTDRMDDIVDPKGASFKLPIPLLYQHDKTKPIGHVTTAKITKDGITIKAQIAKGVVPYIDEAWALIKAGLVKGLSIGFRPTEDPEPIKGTYGVRFGAWEWLELSAVTIPANADASILSIKSADEPFLRAAIGENAERQVVRLNTLPGTSGQPETPIPKGKPMSTYQEQTTAYEAKRAATAAQFSDVLKKAMDEGRTLDETEKQKHDELKGELKAIDEHLVILKDAESLNITKAVPIKPDAGTDPDKGTQARSGIISVKRNVPSGTAFTRYVCALALARGNRWEALEYAKTNKTWHDQTPEVETVLRTAVAAGTTTDSTWAEPLVEYNTMAGEFIELLRPATVIGRIPGLRRVPFNIRMASQTSGSSTYWVGEGKPKPVSKLGFSEVTLRWAKAAGIVVLTEELVRASNPSAEAVVRADMVAQNAQFLDEQFLNPEVGEVSNVSPGSITAGVTPTTVSGTSAAAVRTDFAALLQTFIDADINPEGLVFVMTHTTALKLSLMMNALDQQEFPGITMNGGSLFGIPVITSQSAFVSGSPTRANIIVLMKPSEILLADDGQVVIDASREASLQMLDNPTNESGGSTAPTTVVSMFQTNSVAIRAERWINWKRRRTEAVAWLNNVLYA